LEVLGVISSNEAAIATSNYQGNAETLPTRPVASEAPEDDEDLSEQRLADNHVDKLALFSGALVNLSNVGSALDKVNEHDQFRSLFLDHL
jgi:hypothetical protein